MCTAKLPLLVCIQYTTDPDVLRVLTKQKLVCRYGEEFSKVSKQSKVPRRPVRLLYFEGNHYNLLL